MGGAISSTVANDIVSVVNEIQYESGSDVTQYNKCQANFDTQRCVFEQDLNINVICTSAAVSEQIVISRTDASLNNTITQKLLQRAQSSVGSMGIGYAKATAVANNYINSSNRISAVTAATASQISNSIVSFRCRDDIFRGRVNFGVHVSGDFLSSQLVEQHGVASLVSDVTQDIRQEASATVEGLTGFLIALAILIIAVGWVLFRPAQLLLSNRIIIITVVVLALGIIGLLGYLYKWPPFFNDPVDCPNTQTVLMACGGDSCVDAEVKTINMPQPPMRYAFGIMSNEDPNNYTPGMLQLAILTRGGFNETAYRSFEQDPQYTGRGIPNPLQQSGTAYVTNPEWGTYIANNEHALLARYVLSRDLAFDTFMYFDERELCFVNNQEVSAGSPGTYRYVPNARPPSYAASFSSAGTLTGSFGYCDSPSIRVQRAMRSGGYIALLLLIIGIVAFIFLYRGRENEKTKSAQK